MFLLSFVVYSYLERREEVFETANLEHPHILSIIVDIMDQTGTQLPFKGTQDSADDPVKMTIVGIKEHGYGVHIFPTVKTIPKTSNMILYAIDMVIEKWRERHGYYPTTIYIQIDGGGENANRYVE